MTPAELILRRLELLKELGALTEKGIETTRTLERNAAALIEETQRIRVAGAAILAEIHRIDGSLANQTQKEF